MTFFDQNKSLTTWRQESETALPAMLHRWTIKRLDDAFQAFYRRAKKKNGKAGFPRYRGKNWSSFGFVEFSGIRLIDKRLKIKGFKSGLRVHMHRPLPPDPDIRSCTFTRDGTNWYVSLQVKMEAPELREVRNGIGIDVGLNALLATTDGTLIAAPKFSRKAEKEMRRRQRALSRSKRGSRKRLKAKQRVAAWHRKITNTRNTHLHQIAAALVKKYDGFAVEKLNIQGMMRSNLSRSIADASWGTFFQMLCYKAARAGAQYVTVDPRHTSQLCSGCGVIVKKTLSDRTHECLHCGLVMDRDINAAHNILSRAAFKGVVALEKHNVEHQFKRASVNISLTVSN